jgi:hypothetical protein
MKKISVDDIVLLSKRLDAGFGMPAGCTDDEIKAYQLIRQHRNDTHQILLDAIKEAYNYLSDHEDCTPVSGHFDTVPPSLCRKLEKVIETASFVVVEA